MGRLKEGAKIALTGFVIYACVAMAKSLVQLYQARGRVTEAREALAMVQQEHAELAMRLEEVNSDEFREKEVRDKLNRQLPGETVIIVPQVEAIEEKTGVVDNEEESNFQKWMALFID